MRGRSYLTAIQNAPNEYEEVYVNCDKTNLCRCNKCGIEISERWHSRKMEEKYIRFEKEVARGCQRQVQKFILSLQKERKKVLKSKTKDGWTKIQRKNAYALQAVYYFGWLPKDVVFCITKHLSDR